MTGMSASCGVEHLLPAELPAVHHRHHQIEQDDARVHARGQAVERLLAVGGDFDLEPFQLEKPPQHVAGIHVVFDHEHSARRHV